MQNEKHNSDSSGGALEPNKSVKRRRFLGSVGALTAGTVVSGSGFLGSQSSDVSDNEFDPLEATAQDVAKKYRTGELTVQEVVVRYLERIKAFEDELNAIIRLNPHAIDRAAELDAALEADEDVGPLHGVPIILKDNHDTADIPTTAGSVSMAESTPDDDATIVSEIRDAGGVVLAKANLSEFAFSYDTISSFGGTTPNPYDTERHAGGSSGGSAAAMAANLGLLSTGSDTGGSVRVPSAACSLVGLRPSTGLISRDGIVPLSLTEDTSGPMTRTVADTAMLLDVVVGYDSADPETSESIGETPHAEGLRYTDYLRFDGLESARIGVYRDWVGPTEEEKEESDSDVVADANAVADVFDHAVTELEEAGATVVDPVSTPSWDFVYSANVSSGDEFNRDINSYLSEIEDSDAPENLEEIVESGDYAPAISYIEEREAVDEDAVNENVEYLQTLSRRDDLQQSVLSTFAENDLDAIVYPAIRHTAPHIDSDEPWGSNAQLTPALEFPSMTVPAGFTAETEMPVGIEFVVPEFEEEKLIELGYAYEQHSQARRLPDGYGLIDSSPEEWNREKIESWNESQHKRQIAGTE